MLFEPDLIQIVREETKHAYIGGVFPDVQFLDQMCPRLNGIWYETVRLAAYASSIRTVAEDTLIRGIVFRKGKRLMIPNRQLHFDPDIYGDDVDTFRSTRFLENKSLLRSLSWRAFGGGATLCPGRYAAKQTVITFVAMLLRRYEIKLAGSQKMPRLEEGYPVLGLMSSKEGDDLLVKIRPNEMIGAAQPFDTVK